MKKLPFRPIRTLLGTLLAASTLPATAAPGAGMPPQINVAPGEDLTVVDEGTGPVVVFLPGLLGCAYGFRNLTPLLQAEGFRSIVIEPLGLGVSSRPAGADYTLTAQADRVAFILDQLEVASACIVGHGVSATTAIRLTVDRPELVEALISIEGLPTEHGATPVVHSKLKIAKFVSKLTGSTFVRNIMTDGLVSASGDASWVDRRTVRQYFRGANRDLQGTLDVYLSMAAQEEPAPLQPRLGDITCPVLLLIGGAEHSHELAAGDIEDFRKAVPQLQVITMDGAGHFIFEEQPAELAQVVIAFYRAQKSGPGQARADSAQVELRRE